MAPRPPLLLSLSLALALALLLPLAASSGVEVPANATSAQYTWHGLRQPNYETLYTQYEIPLSCGRNMMPLGVVGYYGWLGDLVVTLSNFAAAAGRLRSTNNKRKVALSCAANGGLAITHYALRLYILVTTATQCADVLRIDFDTVLNAALSVGAIGDCYSIVAALGVVVGVKALQSTVPIVVALSLLFHFSITAIYYRSYASFLYIDSSLLRPIMAVSAVPIFLTIAYLLALLVFGCARNRFFALCWAVAAAVTIFHLWGTGMADVMLGRIVGDVYGVEELNSGLGRLNLALASIFPVLSIFAAAVQFV